jgi:FKBP-type peptidyl-prolyl cis-trans isomerase
MLLSLTLCVVPAGICCGAGSWAANTTANAQVGRKRVLPEAGVAAPLRSTDTGWGAVAAEQVPEGLDLAVQKMKRGEVAEVTLAPRYAFGAEGAQRAAGAVPPDASVTYTVELKEFENVSLDTHLQLHQELA